MSNTAALASLLLFSGFAIAQIKAPDCTLSWNWTFNTLGQNACTVAAYLMSTCHGGSFTLDPLQPGHSYWGPSGIDDGDLCKCNTVTYSLLSACDACQQETWIPFGQYVWNCTTVLPPSSFPNPIPSGTRLPQWTLLDVTSENNWNANKSFTVGDSPEIGPGTALSPLGGSGIGPKGTTSPSSSPTSSPSEGGSHTGAIVGGVIGGTVAIAIAGIVTFLRWRRRQAASATRAVDNDNASKHVTSATLMKLYDPNDPTTYPTDQGALPVPEIPAHEPISSYNGSGNALANMPTSLPQGYHGIPTV